MSKFLDMYLRRDWFDTKKRLLNFLKYYFCWNAYDNGVLIAMAVIQSNGVMIRLLVNPKYRGKRIGAEIVKKSNPQIIRCKTDQSSGDPTGFYEKMGYIGIGKKVGRKKNIQLMIKKNDSTRL